MEHLMAESRLKLDGKTNSTLKDMQEYENTLFSLLQYVQRKLLYYERFV